MIAAILAQIWPYVAAIAAAAVAVWRAYLRGQRIATERVEAEQDAAYRDARERIDDEVIDRDVAAALRRLRNRADK